MAQTILTRVRRAIYNEFACFIPGDTKKEKMAVVRAATRVVAQPRRGPRNLDVCVFTGADSGIPTTIDGWHRVSDELGAYPTMGPRPYFDQPWSNYPGNWEDAAAIAVYQGPRSEARWILSLSAGRRE